MPFGFVGSAVRQEVVVQAARCIAMGALVRMGVTTGIEHCDLSERTKELDPCLFVQP